MYYNPKITIGTRQIGNTYPSLFIADIAANHDNDLERAKDLIYLAAENGADVAKFQHFTAATIVSDKGFRQLGAQSSHQKSWEKSVYEVYDDAALNDEWTPILNDICSKAGIIFMTSPYAVDLVDSVDPYIPAYKIGSGDITWDEMLKHIGQKEKPVLLASGASSTDEVIHAMATLSSITRDIVLMQCNTNYTASPENFNHIHLNVLKTYARMFPGIILGLSDHTPGHSTVLGAVALGARVIEKHFTDDNARQGPDHLFSMNPASWKEMVDRTRELESALGTGIKRVEDNEKETVVLQRRAFYYTRDIEAGVLVKRSMIEPLRPCPGDAVPLNDEKIIVGRPLRHGVKQGECCRWTDLN